MKKVIIWISASLLMISCQTDELEALKTEKSALETTINESTTKLNEVNEKINKIESTEKVDYPDVTAVTVANENFEHYISLQGQVEAGNMVMVIPEVGGVITYLPVQGSEGKIIKKGELIAKFDSETVGNNIKELDVQIELAKVMYDKQQKLYDQGLGNVIQLEQTKGQWEALKQTKESLQTQKGKFNLVAPFDGIIEKVYVVQGQMAGPTSPIIMLVGLKERKVVASISEIYLKNLNKGAMVEIEFPALEQTMKNLKVSRVGGFIDPVNRTIDMEVNLDSFNYEKHVPNLMAKIRVRDLEIPEAIVIPSKVILKGSDQSSFVYVLNKNVEKSDSIDRFEVVKTPIETGAMYNGKIVVNKGLKAGDKIVDRGRLDVYEGYTVEVTAE